MTGKRSTELWMREGGGQGRFGGKSRAGEAEAERWVGVAGLASPGAARSPER